MNMWGWAVLFPALKHCRILQKIWSFPWWPNIIELSVQGWHYQILIFHINWCLSLDQVFGKLFMVFKCYIQSGACHIWCWVPGRVRIGGSTKTFTRKWPWYKTFSNWATGVCIFLFFKKTITFISFLRRVAFQHVFLHQPHHKLGSPTDLISPMYSSLCQPSYLYSTRLNILRLYHPTIFSLIQACVKATYWEIAPPHLKQKCTRPTIIFIIFWDFLMFYQIFFSSQVKRSAMISNKHGIYELSHELSHESRKSQNFIDFKLVPIPLPPSPPTQKKKTKKNCWY